MTTKRDQAAGQHQSQKGLASGGPHEGVNLTVPGWPRRVRCRKCGLLGYYVGAGQVAHPTLWRRTVSGPAVLAAEVCRGQ